MGFNPQDYLDSLAAKNQPMDPPSKSDSAMSAPGAPQPASASQVTGASATQVTGASASQPTDAQAAPDTKAQKSTLPADSGSGAAAYLADLAAKRKAQGPDPLAQVDSSGNPLPAYANGNSPSAPINKSPLDPLDRAAMSLGNVSGNIKYLKKKFEDVKVEDGDHLLVKKDGLWYRTDAKNLGEPDAWAATKKIIQQTASPLLSGVSQVAALALNKPNLAMGLNSDNRNELVGDIADLSGKALPVAGMVAGSTLGAAGGPAGSVAAGAAGGAAGEGIRTSLGRLAGTYDTTPQQQLKDIGWEGLLAAGGELVPLGVKPTMKMLGQAFDVLGGKTAVNFAKEQLSSMFGTLTGAGQWSLRRAMDEPPVIDKAAQAIKEIGPSAPRAEAEYVAQGKQADIVRQLAAQADQKLAANWNRDQAELIKNIPDSFKANYGQDVIKPTFQDLEKSGYGANVGDTNPRFKLFSDADIAHRLNIPTEQVPKVMGPETRQALSQVVDTLNKFQNVGTLEGKAGAAKLLALKKNMNEAFADILDNDAVPDSVRRTATQLKQGFDGRMNQVFAKADGAVENGQIGPALQSYLKLNNNYSRFVDGVKLLKDATDPKNIGGADRLVKQLMSDAGSYRTLQGKAKDIADMIGPQGHQALNDLLDWEAAKGFVHFTPAHGGGNSAISTLRGAAKVVQMDNPRVVSSMIDHAQHLTDWLKSLSDSQRSALLKNPQAVAGVANTIARSIGGEQQATQEMLQNSGAMQPAGGMQQSGPAGMQQPNPQPGPTATGR